MELAEEMMGLTEAKRELPGRVNRLESGELDRVVLLRRNHPVAVILSAMAYERFRELERTREDLADLAAALRAKRTDDGTRISLDEVLKMIER
jgi:prevent-host-death family protein